MSIKTIKRILIVAVILLSFTVFLAIGFNSRLEITEYSYTNSKVPEEFDGYRILQISDYHNKDFGDNQVSLIKAVEEQNPDIIVLTGDMVDRSHTEIESSRELVEGIAHLAPTYFITGNHELDPSAQTLYDQFIEVMEENGVVHLDDKSVNLQIDDAQIILTGQKYLAHYVGDYLKPADTDYFNVLLYHGSDNFDIVAPFGYDLVLSGHVHGGVIRLPLIGGIFGNDGELFPKYDAGMFENGNATLISNRGIGDADLPRFFNSPEITVITLHND